ncbi:MAG: peptide chain release factor N(5)-glutamine methyltransferase [Terricaulis sp.]
MSATLLSLWTSLRRRLEAEGVDSPVTDARVLIEAGAGVSRLDIVTDPYRELSEAQRDAVEALAMRRASREPIAYILGRKAFWNIELAVGPAVLIPRPETELLVEAALEMLAREAPARVLDLGVGSGAIMLAVLAERPSVTGVGVDRSTGALAFAAANAAALGLSERAHFVEGDWAAEGRFDLVLSNPPYIRSADIPALTPELHYEPRLALDGGGDGMDAFRAILAALPELLTPSGAFAFEVGEGQADSVAAMAEAKGLTILPHRRDLHGIARVVAGRAPG